MLMILPPVDDYNSNLQYNLDFDPFEDKLQRKKFVRNTLGFFLFSILCTFGNCVLFHFLPNIKQFITSESGQAISILSISSTSISIITILCYTELLRKSPHKYFFYLLFIFGFSWLVSLSTLYVNSNILISAIAITACTTFTLTLYAIISKTDFTSYTEYLIAGLFVIIFTGLVNLFFYNTIIQLMIAGFSCLIFSIFIIVDIQMILGRKHIKFRYHVDDYILASLNLYLDVINFFLYLLQFLTLGESN